VCFTSPLHARLRVRRAPGIPHALCFLWAHGFVTTRATAPRECGVASDENERATLAAVIVRESGRSSIPETLMIKSRGRGVLDRPVKADDDGSLWRSDLSAVAQGAKAEATKRSIPLFRDGPKDQTSDAQLRIGNFEVPGSMLRIAPERRP